MLVLGLVDLPGWAILLLLCVAFYLYETRNHNFFKNQGIPFLKPVIVFGSMMVYSKGMAEGDLEIYRKHKKRGMVGEFFGDRITLTVWDEKFVADVLVKESSSFVNHLKFTDPTGLMGKMLFNMTDEKWKSTRTEMSPTFTTGKLKTMNMEINHCAKAFGEYLLEKAETGEAIDVKDYTGGYTMSVISSTAFGMHVDSLKDKDNIFVKNAKAVFDIRFDKIQIKGIVAVYFPVLASLLRRVGFTFDMISAECEHFFENVTQQALHTRKEDKDQSRTDFLQLMVNAQKGEDIQDQDEKTSSQLKGLSTDEIIANAMLFFAAGYDTTANTLSFLMYSLATNPEVQTRLIEEIDTVVKDEDSVSYSMYAARTTLPRAVHQRNTEAVSYYNQHWDCFRLNRLASRDIMLHGVYIRKGMVVQVPVFAMQRDSERWPDPERFDPERFSPENKRGRNPYHYLPFGCGPRICIGQRLALQELKLAVIHMLKRVTVETCDNTEIPIKFAKHVLLKPAALWLRTVKR